MSKDFSTIYLDVSDVRKIISLVGLPEVLRMTLEQIREDYSNWEQFEKSPRTANHCKEGVIELMPISNEEYFSFKYVNGHPVNPNVGLPTIMSFGAFTEMKTGFPLLLSEMTILTAIRTAATSVLAAMYMSAPKPEIMAMIGNGAQSEFQIIAFAQLMGIKKFRLYDTDPNATKKLIRNLSSKQEIELIPCNSSSEAANGANIVTTCTADKKYATILRRADVREGMHINAIGGDCPGKTELEKLILEACLKSGTVVVEYTPQSRIEGEIQQMPEDFPVTELYEVILGQKKGRGSDSEITIFDSVGFSLEDYSVLKLFYELAKKHKVGSTTEILPSMSDVKDLFGVLNNI